jgi:hypothetical protein
LSLTPLSFSCPSYAPAPGFPRPAPSASHLAYGVYLARTTAFLGESSSCTPDIRSRLILGRGYLSLTRVLERRTTFWPTAFGTAQLPA